MEEHIKTILKYRKILHDAFEVGIFLKGVDGVLEITGGIMLYLVSPSQINRLVFFLTSHELSEDPGDVIANLLIKWARHLSVGTKLFGSFYLVSHGIIKVGIVTSLWKRRLWAYPAAIVFFALFILYQVYRYHYSRSIWLVFLTILDFLIVILTWLEYRRMRRQTGTLPCS
jgi:uncharacterized membrane protein